MNDIDDLIESWEKSPFPSTKISTYFTAYSELFSQYRNSDCVFIETGVLGGGSLFMWRKWLGPNARIIGIDLNPEALKWIDHGFEIFIGDQGDPNFWQKFYKNISHFDVLLDDGGHQSFQQIVTVEEALKFSNNKCIIAVEDTHTSFMNDFNSHGLNSFLNYAKDSSDVLTSKSASMYPSRFPIIDNKNILNLYKSVYSVQFFNSLVAFKIDPDKSLIPDLIWNKRDQLPTDFRYHGVNVAEVTWPNPFIKNSNKLISGNG